MSFWDRAAETMQSRAMRFWRNRSREAQLRIALVCLTGVLLLGATVWAGLYAATRRTAQEAELALERHMRVAGMVQEILNLENTRGRSLAGTPLLIAARQVSRDIGLEEKLTSVRPALQGAGRDGVQLYFERLDLAELVALVESLQREAGLQTSTLTFNRRLDNPGLADLQLVLFR